MKKAILGLCWLLSLLAPALSAAADTSLEVVVSTHPVARVLAGLAPGDDIAVETLLGKGVTPHDVSLRPRQLQQLMDADLAVWMGAEVEPYLASWMRKRQGPTLDLGALPGLKLLPLRAGVAHDHGHGHTREARHDVHWWWSRHNLLLATDALAAQIGQLQPQRAAALEERRQQTHDQFRRLHEEYTAGKAIPAFAVFHDGWQYLERDLGQSASAGFVLDGELSMGARHLAKLQKHFAAHPVQCVLLEPSMNTALVGKVLPGVPTVTLDPMGRDAPGTDVAAMLRHAYEALSGCGGTLAGKPVQ